MTQTSVAMVAEQPTNLSSFVVVVHNQRLFGPTNYTLFGRSLDVRKLFIRYGRTVLAPAICVSVFSTARTAPAIKAIALFVVRRKKRSRGGFFLFATSTAQQFHAFNDSALRVGRPLSSFIGPGIPLILAQKESRRLASDFVFGCGAGGFRPGLPGFALL